MGAGLASYAVSGQGSKQYLASPHHKLNTIFQSNSSLRLSNAAALRPDPELYSSMALTAVSLVFVVTKNVCSKFKSRAMGAMNNSTFSTVQLFISASP